MAKIIEFPTGRELKHEKSDAEIVNEVCQDMTELAQHMIDIIEDELMHMDIPYLMGMNIRKEIYAEGRDTYVLANFIYAMFLRYLGMDHQLTREMDRAYIRIKKLAEQKKQLEKDNDTT